LQTFFSSLLKKKIANVSFKLMENLQDNSEMKLLDYRHYGGLTTQIFSPRLSKPLIDKIDMLLAKPYGFTNEELDFIINYDIKYRMGAEAEGEG